MTTEMELEEEFAKAPLRRANLGRLVGYLRPYRSRLAVALGMELLWVVSILVDPRVVRLVVDGPMAAKDVGGTAELAVLLVVNLLFRALLTVIELRILLKVGISALHDIRSDVFDHVQRLSMRYFDRTKQGRIIARADRDVDTLEHLLVWGPVVLVSLCFTMMLGFVELAYLHPDLAKWVLGAMPAMWIVSRIFQKFGFPAYRRVRETHSRISAHVAESITGVRVVKAFSAEDRELDRLLAAQGDYRSAVLRGVRVTAGYVPALLCVFLVLLLATLVSGGNAVVQGTLATGGLVELVMLLGFVLGPVEGLGGLYGESLVAAAAAERIFLLLDTEPEIRDREGATDPGRLTGDVEFRSVGFAYDPEMRSGLQLDGIDFHVTPGETVALVGHTGAGKTSIVNLLARFYEAQHGSVVLDGRDIRDLRLDRLHAQMGMVLQENFLFAGTVFENLRFVNPDLTEQAALDGFTALGCDEILQGLADGLDTDVGERGANLSEGERQIVCFVRALLARPAILILDEATSAVDTRTEALLLRALRELTSRQTTFIVAHRLSTIRHADRILVLEMGKVVEEGRHDDLVARGGTYAGLYAEYGA